MGINEEERSNRGVTDDDTEGHGSRMQSPDELARGRQLSDDEEDVEGHSGVLKRQ